MTSLMGQPTADGRFGDFGGRFLPESLVPACAELEAAFTAAWAGACLHGLAGDTLAEWMGDRGVVAGDLLKALPLVIHQVSTA